MSPRFIAKQLSRPTGLGGWVIRGLMNRGNADLNTFAVEQLGLTPESRVLEIGFGGGVALPPLFLKAWARMRGRSVGGCGQGRRAAVRS